MDLAPLARPIEYLLSGITSTSAIITRFIRSSVRAAHADLGAVTRDLSDLRLVLELLRDESDVPLRLQGQILVLLESCGNVLIRVDNILARCPEPAKWLEFGREEITRCRTTLALFRAALALALEVVTLNSSKDNATDVDAGKTGLRADVGQLMEHARSAEHGTPDAEPVLAAYLTVVASYVTRPDDSIEGRKDKLDKQAPPEERDPVFGSGVASLRISGEHPSADTLSKDEDRADVVPVPKDPRKSWTPSQDGPVPYTEEPRSMTPRDVEGPRNVLQESPTLGPTAEDSLAVAQRPLPPPIIQPIWKRSESLRSEPRTPFSWQRNSPVESLNRSPDPNGGYFPQVARVTSMASRHSAGSSSGSAPRPSLDKFPSPHPSDPPPDYRRTWVDGPVSLPSPLPSHAVPVPVKSPHRSPLEIIPRRHLTDKGKGSEVLHIDTSPSSAYIASKHGNKLVKIWSVPRNALHGTIKTTSYVQPRLRSREYFIRSHAILSESATLIAVTTHFGLTIEIYNFAKGANSGAKKVQVIEDAHRWAASQSDEASFHHSHERAGMAVYRPKPDRIDRFFLAHPGAKNPLTQDPARSIELLRADLPFLPKFPELAYNSDASLLVAAAGPRPGDPVRSHSAILVAWRVDHGQPPTAARDEDDDERHKPYRVCVPPHPALHSALPTCLAVHGDVAVSVWIPASTTAESTTEPTGTVASSPLTPSSTTASAGSAPSSGGKSVFSFRSKKHHHTVPPATTPSPLSVTPSNTTLHTLSHAPTISTITSTLTTATTTAGAGAAQDRIVLVWHLPTNTTRLFAIPIHSQAAISPDCRRLAYCSVARGEFVVVDLRPLIPPFFSSAPPPRYPSSAVGETSPLSPGAGSGFGGGSGNEPAPEEIWRWPDAARETGFASFGQMEGMGSSNVVHPGLGASVAGGGGGPSAFEFSRDGRMLVVGDRNGGVGVYEVGGGEEEERFELGVGDEVAWADVVDGGAAGMAAASSRQVPPQLSPGEQFILLLKLFFVAPIQILINLIRCYFLAAIRRSSFQGFAQIAYYRIALHNFTLRELRVLSPPTRVAYETWIAGRRGKAEAALAGGAKGTTAGGRRLSEEAFLKSRLAVDVEVLPDGRSSLLWIGDRKRASKFVYFLHGGGYVVPAQVGHFEWCMRAYLLASPAAAGSQGGGGGEGMADDEVAIAVLQYSHSPEAKYPTQLQQAADGLAHLLASSSGAPVRPSNVVIGGDSAGGNLVAQLLGHLLHPHPAATEVSLSEPLAGAFLVSPWLSAHNDWASVRRNSGIDMISSKTMPKVSDGLLDGGKGGERLHEAEMREGKGWAMPMDLSEKGRVEWFRGLGRVVRKVYVTAGEHEILLDQCVAFVDAVRRGNAQGEVEVRFDIMKSEAHDWLLLEGQREMEGDATRRMREWFRDIFWA
ncbi:hypothetical protein VTJ49DRAFT_6365 [Mycothermus thermophilus]|uniref:Alpha/beta hydrolase fold-3 domain-containing protein n=1 Tax=Humicola insolens TaxID=85995 RepID=A0ABR3VRK9_HUMIN